jgi:undecaprenyl diphosphate synthase
MAPLLSMKPHASHTVPEVASSRTEQEFLQQLNPHKIPKHIAIIMDGNGRWAKQRHLPRVFGHRAGITSVRDIVRACGELHVHVLTLYAFSAENWARPDTEVKALMRLLEEYLQRELPELQKNHVQLRVIGRWQALPAGARAQLEKVIQATAKNKGLILTLALNYGGRQEIVDACNRALQDKAKQLDEDTFSKYLNSPDVPDPDLLIRTSGEMRISNFLLWQLAYTEIYITPTPWPEFRRAHLYQAILDYQRRERRFGGL